MISETELAAIDPYEFEELIARVWEAKGFKTNVTEGSHDRGIDIVAKKAGWKEVIQAKRYGDGNKVGSQKVREYATLYQQEPTANAVVIVTSGEFTDAARELAEDLRVETVAGEELIADIDEYDIDPGDEPTNEPYISKEFNEKCEYCSKEFSSITRLRKHLLNKHKAELHECEDCGEVFIEESSMEQHQKNQHSSEGSSIEQQPKKQYRKGDGEKQACLFKCEYCDLSFANDSDYWKHLTDAHDNELAFCFNCNDHFQSERQFREHLYQEHDASDLGRIDQLHLDQHIENEGLKSEGNE